MTTTREIALRALDALKAGEREQARTAALVAIALALTDPKPREPQVRKL